MLLHVGLRRSSDLTHQASLAIDSELVAARSVRFPSLDESGSELRLSCDLVIFSSIFDFETLV